MYRVLRQNTSYFKDPRIPDIPIVIGSILDKAVVDKLMSVSPECDGYDIVHSWGVLHHTGDMKNAILNAVSLVKNGGYLVIAIYNRHWTSLVWRGIKFLYCKSPPYIQTLMIKIFCRIIWIAKFIVTGKNPKKQSRGMDFFYNVVDWVGGYPYEYASINEIYLLVFQHGFRKIKYVPAQVPTGCNEFVFLKS